METLSRYTVELSPPEGGWSELQRVSARARSAAAELRRAGTPVRFLRSVFVPEDETCFFLFEGPNAAAVLEAASRARLGATQVCKTLTGEPGSQERGRER